MTTPGQPNIHHILLVVCSGTVVALLYFGRELLIPLALAAFVSSLLGPVVRRMERLHLGRVISVMLVVGASCGLVCSVGWLVAAQTSNLISDYPQYRDKITTKFAQVTASTAGLVGKASTTLSHLTDQITGRPAITPDREADDSLEPADPPKTSPEQPERPVRVEVVSPQEDILAMVAAIVKPVVHPLATLFVTAVLVVFFLIHQADLRDRIIRLCGRAQIPVTTAALLDCERRIVRYLVAQVVANCFIGLVSGLGLYALGIPNAALWGLLTVVFRFVPYVGAIVAALFPVAVAVAITDGWRLPLIVGGWCMAVDMLGAYVLEPWLYGARTGVAPTAVLLAFVFWTWLWGGIGLFLATPITVCLVVLGKHIPGFEVFYILMSDEPVLAPQTRFYQRILAMDSDEAVEVAQQFASESSPLQACDQIILPALAQLESDHQVGWLEPHRVDFVRRTIREFLVDQNGDWGPSKPAAEPTGGMSREPLLLVEGSGVFDEMVTAILKCFIADDEKRVFTYSSQSLVTEIVDEILRIRPPELLIATVHVRDSSRIRYILKRLHATGWTRPVHIAILTTSRQHTPETRRLGRESSVVIYTSLGEIARQFRFAPIARPAPAARPQLQSAT